MPLPMSPVDSMFLSVETRQRPMNIGALGLLTPPEGGDATDISKLFAAALANGQAAPLLRRRPRRVLTSLGQWCWHTDTDVDFGYHVRLNALPQPAGMGELWKLVSHLHSGPLDRTRPLWQLHLIEGLADGRYAVYIKIHHALADGVSAMRMVQRSLSTDPDLRGMPAIWGTQRDTPDNDANTTSAVGLLTGTRRLLGAVVEEAAGVVSALADTSWRALRGHGGPLTLVAPHTPFNVPIGSARSFAGRTFPLDRLRRVATST